MKERTIVGSVVGLLAFVAVMLAGNTDLIYIVLSIASFAVCIAYAEGCEKL
jgi:hypothetical protein